MSKKKWDISEIGSWKTEQFPRGAMIPEAGNSADYRTGGWRSERPCWDPEKCKQCLLCWIYCPDAAIRVKDEKIVSFDYEHCKGCGVCAAECPFDAIRMEPEGSEVKK